MKPTRLFVLLAGFLVALGLLGAVAWVEWRQINRVEAATVLVSRTHQVLNHLVRLLSLMQDIENGARGFLVTGEPAFLEPFEAARGRVDDEFKALCTLTSDNLHQQTHCKVLAPLIAKRIAVSQATVDLRRNVGFEAAQKAVAGGVGKALMDQIRVLIGRMDAEEHILLAARTAEAKRAARASNLLIAGGTVLALLLIVGTFALVLRENQLRRRSQAELDRFFTLSLDLLCIANMDGYFKRLSPAFTQTLGYTTDQLTARPFLDFVHPDDHAATLAEVEKLSRGEPTIQFENRYRHQDSSWRWLAWKAQPDKD